MSPILTDLESSMSVDFGKQLFEAVTIFLVRCCGGSLRRPYGVKFVGIRILYQLRDFCDLSKQAGVLTKLPGDL